MLRNVAAKFLAYIKIIWFIVPHRAVITYSSSRSSSFSLSESVSTILKLQLYNDVIRWSAW